MLTRISNEKMKEVLLEVADRYYDAEVDVTVGHIVLTQAQLEADQERVREIFEEIEDECRFTSKALDGAIWILPDKWQALKEKWGVK